jgi:hypothetical protein
MAGYTPLDYREKLKHNELNTQPSWNSNKITDLT